MKKNVKKLLSSSASEILPDDKVKENIKIQLGAHSTQTERAYAHGGSETSAKKRNLTLIICAFAILIAVIFCIFIPNLFKKGALNNLDKFNSITTTSDFYAYGAASVGSLVSSDNTENRTYSLSDNEKQTVNKYMSLVEELLSDGVIEHTDKKQKNGNFEYVMKVKYKDLLGEPVEYTMYYNRTYLGGEKEDDEQESKYSISGVLVIGENEYEVEGKIEIESEEDEEEITTYFRAYTDENSYIEVLQENETENENGESEVEKKYHYSVYEKGKRIERTLVEYENEDGELSLKMTVEKDGAKDELRFKKERNQTSTINVFAKMGGEDMNFKINIKNDKHGNGYYEYDFKN